jgi:hypothetical protein
VVKTTYNACCNIKNFFPTRSIYVSRFWVLKWTAFITLNTFHWLGYIMVMWSVLSEVAIEVFLHILNAHKSSNGHLHMCRPNHTQVAGSMVHRSSESLLLAIWLLENLSGIPSFKLVNTFSMLASASATTLLLRLQTSTLALDFILGWRVCSYVLTPSCILID